LKRVWVNAGREKSAEDSKELLIKLNQTIAGVLDDIENFRFNTYIAKLMELNNTIEKVGKISPESYQKFLLLLYPAAPHIASELWQELGFGDSIEAQNWPKADSKYLIADEIEIVVQVNGKVRDKLMVSSDISDEELKKAVLNLDKIKQLIADKEIKKTIIIPRKLISIVVQQSNSESVE
jgi:leucyl-tRNA synthetase